MPHIRRLTMTVSLLLVVLMTAGLFAHQMTVQGTVAAIERARIQVKTGEEKKGVAPVWYPIDTKTKIMRGKKAVTFDEAKIVVGERVVVNVDHESDTKMTTIDIRLAEK